MRRSYFGILLLVLFYLPSNEIIGQINLYAKQDTCHVYSISMNEICDQWDGQWQGITVGSDGNCYFGSSTHSIGHGAGFHKFDPETLEHEILAEDLTIVCNEEDSDSQQGKIHSPIVEHDGWLYFATHLSNYWPEGIELYPGAHVLGYNIANGEFRDFGVIRDRFSIYSFVNVDPARNVLYVFVSPFHDELRENDGCHLYSIDINSGKKRDLGLINKGGGASFTSFVDSKGRVWFTLWKRNYEYEGDNGNLYCYDPETEDIEIYRDVLPAGILMDGTSTPSKEVQNQSSWTWSQALPGNEKCLFTMGSWGGGDERLWIFDPSKEIAFGEAFEAIANIGSTFLQTALGGDRLYFVQFANPEDERTRVAEADRDRDPDLVGYHESQHLRSVSIVPGGDNKIVDHGKIVDQNGRAARFINSLAADDEGRVYMFGSWYINSYKEATFQILFSEYPGENIYQLMKRGEFFAFYDPNK